MPAYAETKNADTATEARNQSAAIAEQHRGRGPRMQRDARRENRTDSRADSQHHRRGTACRRQHGDSCSLEADSMTHEERHDHRNDREAIEANEANGTVAESSTRNRDGYPRFSCGAFRDGGLAAARRGSAGVGGRGASPERDDIISGSGDEVEGGAEEDAWPRREDRAAQPRQPSVAAQRVVLFGDGHSVGSVSQSRRVVKCRAWRSARCDGDGDQRDASRQQKCSGRRRQEHSLVGAAPKHRVAAMKLFSSRAPSKLSGII